MPTRITLRLLASAALIALGTSALVQAQQGGAAGMSFFVTSAGSGKGADLGGLQGADQRCEQLAQAAAPAARRGTPI